MMTLKCDLCGYEQIIKKRIDKDIYYELTHNQQLRCGNKKCKECNDYSIPDGLICRCMVFGNWSTINIPTIEELQGIRRAKNILKSGLSGKSKKI